ncbi:MAG: histidine phosphatase family protein [Chloroflexi bacterium]|nr:histidine phosphatase family protein [Chloroflexota bacterium]MCA2000531.1 histidine phosphatase family protein [Chloroflexota bacterium]
MPLLLLIRHGENDYVKTGKLAGRLPGVRLNERGQKQAQALGEALKDAPLKAVYSSPLERAMETAAPIASARGLRIIPEPDLMDTDVGKWQGRSWKVLRLTKAWQVVQRSPSRFRFPDGESFPETQVRVVNVLERIIRSHKPQDIVAAVFHADPIKLAAAHFLGMPLDNFQRLGCDTGSVTALQIGETGASLIRLNQRPPFEFLKK